MLNMKLSERETQAVPLVGSFCEIHWTSTNRMAKRQCEKCVYLVRGIEGEMLCVELIYDAIEGEHRHDHIYWVPTSAVQTLRLLTLNQAQHRVEILEKQAYEDLPRD